MTEFVPGAPRRPDHEWFEKRNHIKSKRIDMNMRFFDARFLGVSPEDTIEGILDNSTADAFWIWPRDLDTLFSDLAGTIPAVVDGPVGFILNKYTGGAQDVLSGVSPADGNRPILREQSGTFWLEYTVDSHDMIIPAGGWSGNIIYGSEKASIITGSSIPAGSFAIQGAGQYMAGNAMYGAVVTNGTLTVGEREAISEAIVSIGAVRDFTDAASTNYFRFATWLITDFTDFNNMSTNEHSGSMYREATALIAVPNSVNWTFGAVTIMANMFNNCAKLEDPIDVSNWDLSLTTSVDGMFVNCGNIDSIDISNWDLPVLANMNNFATNCLVMVPLTTGDALAGLTNVAYLQFANNCALDVASLDNILITIESSGTSNGFLDLGGGNNGIPSAAGLTAKTALQGRGWVVNTKI